MISGALFLRAGKMMTVHTVFHKYVKRLLICYITWTVIYDVFYTVMNKGDAECFILHLFETPVHLWYLMMLIGMYLMTPVLRQITKDRAMTLYMIWILLVFGIVFGTIKGITGFFETAAVWIGSRSLGIYLVHRAVLDWLEHYRGLTVASYMSILSVPLISILVFITALVITAVLKKIPLIRNTVS